MHPRTSSVLVFTLTACFIHAPISSAAPADPGARLGRLDCRPDEIAKFDGSKWGCAEDETGGIAIFDAEGERIGPVINVRDVSNVEAMVELIEPLSGEVVTVLLGFNTFNVIPHGSQPEFSIYFVSGDCTGTAYISNNGAGGFELFTYSVVVACRLYVPVSDQQQKQPVLLGSRLSSTFSCDSADEEDIHAPSEAYEAVLLGFGHELFPPPYTLETE